MADWPESRLRDIQSITDAGMSRLGEEDFLTELLGRLKDVLQVDIAAIMLLDTRHEQLIATAAAGLEEEVRQGVRVPVGQGFAGRVAAEGRPVILHQVDQATVHNPILLDKGIQSLLGVPLEAGGTMLGVLNVGSQTARRFTAQDTELLQLAADRAATAVQSIMARDDQIAIAALQRSLIPTALPMIPGAELAGRYIPGRGVVGGDWYDVFTLPSGELGLVIGDVAGSGLAAGVIMGRIRSALRAYALETLDPAEVLARLDRKMQHFESGAMATVLYVIIDSDLSQARMASAGHLPPVVASPGQPAALAGLPANLMIGVSPDARRQVTTVDITPGTVLCLYTDGLIERPGEVIDDGFTRLCRVVSAQPPDDVCAAVMAAFVGSEPARDDIALLMFRRQPRALSPA